MSSKPKDKSLRNLEYYGMLDIVKELYDKSLHNVVFKDLTSIIFSESNIRLAFRNIKNNNGSKTCGVDKKTIKDIKKINLRYFIEYTQNCINNYQLGKIRRVLIPKSNGKLRPLGIPTIIDRIIQQCILQVLEPIMEAKFHKNSNEINKYTSSGQEKIHTVLDCMNYETIKCIVSNPFDCESLELNDVIISKLASQYGKCYVSGQIINKNNIAFVYEYDKILDRDSYQNIIIVTKEIK